MQGAAHTKLGLRGEGRAAPHAPTRHSDTALSPMWQWRWSTSPCLSEHLRVCTKGVNMGWTLVHGRTM